jgi:Ca2+-binding RTX toxin-like protein
MVGVRKTVLLLALITLGLLLASGVVLAATFTGDDSNNVIYGGSNDDTIDGKGGADALNGKGGRDTLYGGPGNDNAATNLYDKVTKSYVSAGVLGAAGNDKIEGQEGDDDLEGNGGRDTLNDTSPNDADKAWGGSEDDTINVADGDFIDEADCGEGPDGTINTDKDTAKIDVAYSDTTKTTITGADKVASNCEVVTDQDGTTVDQAQIGRADDTLAAGDMDHLFRGSCFYSHSNTGDPIALPDSTANHMHEFFGNDTTIQTSTAQTLQQDSPYLKSDPSKLQCNRETNKSSYWVPRITWNNQEVLPTRSGVYYATRTGLPPEKTTTTPFGFKVIAKSSAAVAEGQAPAGSEAKLYWHCHKLLSAHQSIASGTPTPPTSCPVDKSGVPTLGVTVLFPQCWDGQAFDVKGGANMRHAIKDSSGTLSCPSGFPQHIPQLAMFINYDLPSTEGPLKVLGHGGVPEDPDHFHADYFNSEDLESLVQKCIREGQGATLACGGGGDTEG